MARVFTISAFPNPQRSRRAPRDDKRYVEGQRLLVQAIEYLAKTDRRTNKQAIFLLSEHVRTRFRMSDSPLA